MGLAADFARQMKEVTLAALDRINKGSGTVVGISPKGECASGSF